MTTWLDLTDTPDSYAGQSGKIPVVKDDESGLELKSTEELSSDLGSVERPDCTDLADDDVRAIEDPDLREKIYRVTEAIKRCLDVYDRLLFGADLLGGVKGRDGVDGAPGATGAPGQDGETIINQNGSSPAFAFSRSGEIFAGTWLFVDKNPSNITGKRNNLYNSSITGVHLSTSTTDTYTIGVYYHDGSLSGLVLVDTFAVVASNGEDFVGLSYAIPKSKQMAMKIETGTIAAGIDAGIIMAGTLTP